MQNMTQTDNLKLEQAGAEYQRQDEMTFPLDWNCRPDDVLLIQEAQNI